MEDMIEISPSQQSKALSIGEAFVVWAEKYWGLQKIAHNQTDGGESCPYDYIKKTFAQKIDELVKDRIEGAGLPPQSI